MRRDEFRNLVREFLLREVEEPASFDPSRDDDVGESSVDAQVDSLLVSYEKNATSSKNEGNSVRAVMQRFLFEAGGSEEGDEDAPAAEEPDASSEQPAKKTVDDIDVESFATDVARLIDNYDNLLEIRDTLVRRARDFLRKSYDDLTVNDFLSMLRDKFDIEIGMSQHEKDAEVQAPAADRAGANPS